MREKARGDIEEEAMEEEDIRWYGLRGVREILGLIGGVAWIEYVYIGTCVVLLKFGSTINAVIPFSSSEVW